MKKLLLIFTFINGLAFGQLQISDWKTIGKVGNRIALSENEGKVKLSFLNSDNLLFSDVTGTPERTFIFTATEKDLEDIYNVIKKTYEAKEVKEINLSFPEGDIVLNFYKGFGGYALEYKTKEGNTFPMGMKEVNKIFGKTKKIYLLNEF